MCVCVFVCVCVCLCVCVCVCVCVREGICGVARAAAGPNKQKVEAAGLLGVYIRKLQQCLRARRHLWYSMYAQSEALKENHQSSLLNSCFTIMLTF